MLKHHTQCDRLFISGTVALCCLGLSAVLRGCVESKLGRDVSAHLLSFFKEPQRDTGEEGDHTEGGREAKIIPILRLSARQPPLQSVLLGTRM